MAEKRDERLPEPTMDAASLYREEVYTDRKVGTIRALIPVTGSGTADSKRPTLYVGEAQIYTNMGALPLSFEIEASGLEQALKGYAAAAKEAIERALREIEDMRRQAASSIVIPRGGAGGMGPGGLGPGGLGGGGKIQLP